jgi:hypothetical protein
MQPRQKMQRGTDRPFCAIEVRIRDNANCLDLFVEETEGLPMGDKSRMEETIRRVVWGRRFLAATVVVPPSVAEHLNTDAMAVLAVIRDEAKVTGRCTLPLARIAERANIGRAKARAAIRLAESLGAIAIEEAPDRKRVIVNLCVTSRC